MLKYHEALQIIFDEASLLKPKAEAVDILLSLNRIIAEDIFSDIDLPPFNNSAMDGYAFRFSNLNEWKIVGEISAGNFSEYQLANDEAVLITTGSKLPSSADSVVPLEDVEILGNKIKLKSDSKIKSGMNVRLRGSDLKMNELVIQKYSLITPQIIAALASCGKESVSVHSKLKIAVLATGDELIPISQKPTGDKLRVSNSYSIYAAVNEINHLPVILGFVNDDRAKIESIISDSLNSDIDILITTGGVSVGKYDFLLEIFKELGVEIKFWKVNIKPGKPIVFGVYHKNEKRILVFGLPGNPVSSLVNFQIFVKSVIEKIYKQTDDKKLSVILQNDLKKNDNKRYFSRGNIFYEKNEWRVSALASQSSGNFVEMSKANCLIEIPEEVLNPKKGDAVQCIMI